MKLTIDESADALYLILGDLEVSESRELAPGVIFDYDAEGQVIGIEMLHLSKQAPGANPRQLLIESIPQAGPG